MNEYASDISTTLKIIGSKWTVHILFELSQGVKRFGELERKLEHISPRTLSQRLKQLEQTGVVNKHIFPEVPPHVEYSLTPRGETLRQIIDTMHEWGKTSNERV